MDSISQAALGAAIGEAVLGKKIGNKGALLGALVGTIPDLDVSLYLFYDKLEMLSIHRGFSHSMLFSVLGAFLIAYILKRIKWTNQVKYGRLWLFAWAVLITHMLLDAFTSYGTQLFSPFSDARIGFDSINVVDPIYTIPLLTGLIFSILLFKNRAWKSIFNYIGLAISTLYLLATLGIKHHVNTYFHSELSDQKIRYHSLLTMPVGSANINWYGVAKSEDSLYMQKYSILKGGYFPFEAFAVNDHLLNEIDPEMAERMRWFAKGFYTVRKVGNKIRVYNLQVDMRGIVEDRGDKAPTKGYFEIECDSFNSCYLSSGSHKKE